MGAEKFKVDEFLSDKKKAVQKQFDEVSARRERDLATLNSLKGQFSLIEELQKEIEESKPKPEEA